MFTFSRSALGNCLSASDLNNLIIEIIPNTVYKAYFEDLYSYCLFLGGSTSDVMTCILSFKANQCTVNITINSFNTDLLKEDIGRLFPEGNNQLAKADEIDQVRMVCENMVHMGGASNGDNTGSGILSQLKDHFFHLNKLTFLQQFQYGVFYAYTEVCLCMKLKEQEIRNITWIAECIAQNAKDTRI
ncbi:ATPase, V0/A0 complex, subunit C/D [Gymnopus androsaceus JB14]|uniref:ATPase, V0/A0 complex, subunit C/D n=1 Tax=Gymnopus androsaceus JB14 TaxID=1447944 RepID=A0A6A4GRY5_9AGAR|nr:ATPase, V0/A0 complex, subunit C/D [Gymnopus androsaceus JB14]